jgi:WD40 repeat protein
MNKKLIFSLGFLILGLALQAQNQDLIIELVSKEPIKKSTLDLPQGYTGVRDYDDSIAAYESSMWAGRNKLAEKMTIIYDNKQFDVETLPEIEISPEANLLIKYGDNELNPSKSNFVVIYYDLNGNKIRELNKKYEGASLSLSKNGLVAMAGRLLEHQDSDGSSVSLYDINGEELFTKDLGPDNCVRDLRISPNGNYIALVYSTFIALANDRFNLMILKKDGTVLFDRRYYNVFFHHLIFSPDEKFFLGIAHPYICLLNLNSQNLIWEQNKYYKTGKSPVLFFDKFNSLLIQTRFKGIFTLHLLDIKAGGEIYQTELPDKQASTYEKSLYQKSKDEFIIVSPTNTYNFKINPRN